MHFQIGHLKLRSDFITVKDVVESSSSFLLLLSFIKLDYDIQIRRDSKKECSVVSTMQISLFCKLFNQSAKILSYGHIVLLVSQL